MKSAKVWKKSDLQLELELQGWELITNMRKDLQRAPDPYSLPIHHSYVLEPYDSSLQRSYLERGFKAVRVEDAFNSEGKPIKSMRAVYVNTN